MRNLLSLTLSVLASTALADCPSDWSAARKMVSAIGPVPDCGFEAQACRWSFALGVPQSRQKFEALRAGFAACPDLVEVTRDAGVNHPDYYDAWAFRFKATAMTLSIKDKSALDQTYVVLRAIP